MVQLFEVKPHDLEFYRQELADFVPQEIIDIHTHVWLKSLVPEAKKIKQGVVSWPSRVAEENSIEDLLETYRLLLPGCKVTPLIFANIAKEYDASNLYVSECAAKHQVPALLFSIPEWSGNELRERLVAGNFLGCKSYLTCAPDYLPTAQIRIFDYFPLHQLEVLNQLGLILMLHIPRTDRLRDPVNLAQILEIEERYPNIKLIIAHVGRAYCNEDVGQAFEILRKTNKMYFDISANTNAWVFARLIEAVGPGRILFGSDLPILRMRAGRTCRDGTYINKVPTGLYGDVSAERNMEEVTEAEAGKLTFLFYEEIAAFKRASEETGLSAAEIQEVFYDNSKAIIEKARFNLHKQKS